MFTDKIYLNNLNKIVRNLYNLKNLYNSNSYLFLIYF